MIPARKEGLIGWLSARYVDLALRWAFRGVWVRGALTAAKDAQIFYANHPGWWDGFAFCRLAAALQLEAYCVMEEQNLARYPFLARLGAFSIRRGDPSSALESLRYAKGLLARPRTGLLIFPQGVLLPGDATPKSIERGVEVLARLAGVSCIPLAIRYAFLEERRPHVMLQVGSAHPPGPIETFRQALSQCVESLSQATSLNGFTQLPSLGHL